MEQIPLWTEAVIETLLRALRARDPYTYGHCLRVAHNAKLLAAAAGLPESRIRIVEYSSLLHDLGKLGIPDRVLFKRGPLTHKEELVIHSHPEMGIEILEPLLKFSVFADLVPGIKHHHECVDGKGYPHGLSGEDIPIEARIILIADTFDAITTTRPYREASDAKEAYQVLRDFCGKQFDADLAQLFLRLHPTWGEYHEDMTEEFIASHFKRAA